MVNGRESGARTVLKFPGLKIFQPGKKIEIPEILPGDQLKSKSFLKKSSFARFVQLEMFINIGIQLPSNNCNTL
jgi:hypothetical protein